MTIQKFSQRTRVYSKLSGVVCMCQTKKDLKGREKKGRWQAKGKYGQKVNIIKW